MNRFMCSLCFAVFVLLCACSGQSGPSYVIDASDFDRSCSFDSDCMLVTTGDFCGCTACSKGAIAESAQDAYDAEIERAIEACDGEQRGCPSLTEARIAQALTCEEFRSVCNSGSCATESYSEISEPVADVVDRSCVSDSDCTTVPESFDESCGCGVAVSNSGAGQAENIAWSQGGYTEASCDCAPEPQRVQCVSGRCRLEGDAGCEVTAWSANVCR
jgi:hypothetical protein